MLKERGLKVPDDISLIGYGNNSICLTTTPKLASVIIPMYDLGKNAATLLIKQIKDEKLGKTGVVLPVELILRESVKPLIL